LGANATPTPMASGLFLAEIRYWMQVGEYIRTCEAARKPSSMQGRQPP
jgi:hypothetical protein